MKSLRLWNPVLNIQQDHSAEEHGKSHLTLRASELSGTLLVVSGTCAYWRRRDVRLGEGEVPTKHLQHIIENNTVVRIVVWGGGTKFHAWLLLRTHPWPQLGPLN